MMSHPKVAKEFFEANLPDEIKQATDLSSLKPQKDSFIDDKLRLQIADMLFETKFNGEKGYFYVLMEHMSTPQKLLPLRILKYVTAIQENHMTKAKSKVLPFVYPLILYSGAKPYTYSMDLYDLYGSNKDLAKKTMGNPYHLIDLTKLPDEELQKYIWFGTMCLLAKHVHDADLLPFVMNQLAKMLKILDSLGEEDYIIKCVTYIYETGEDSKTQDIVKMIAQNFETITEEKVMTIAERLRQEGRQEGLEKAAIALIKDGMELSKVSSILSLSESKLKKLKETTH